jgi:GxxExxY protein
MDINDLSGAIIGAAIEVHRQTGPGLLESAYEACLAFELSAGGIPFERQKELPLLYKGNRIDVGFRIDLLVADTIVVELKAVERTLPIHKAQVITYLKLTGCKLGLLINFNVHRLINGVERVALDL